MQKALAVLSSQFSITEADFFPSYPLSRLTTLRIGGPCELLAVPKSEDALLRLLSLLDAQGMPRVILGNGSNLLAPDEGYRGVVIRTSGLCRVTATGDVVCAECGAPLSAIVQVANKAGIGGLAPLAGIPATLGGAIFMNAGAFGACIGDGVLSVRAVPAAGGRPLELTGGECGFSYRESLFQARTLVVLSAVLGGAHRDPAILFSESADALKKRKDGHPIDRPNAGSIFRRPPKGYAGALIEAAGLKGMRVGGAMVSERHAGFIVNIGGATAADVRTLIAIVQSKVYEHTGIRLVREIEYLGE